MNFVSYFTILVYNGIILFISIKSISEFDFKSALSDKDPQVISERADAAAKTADIRKSFAAIPADQKTAGTEKDLPKVTDPEASSYSRFTGMFGLIIMGSFLWALGNALIWSMFNNVENIRKIVADIGSFFLSGSALFAPYAFNQIKESFKKQP